ncbi:MULTISPECIES: FecR family protein [Sphingobacterium]|uniref:FecR family protein n=1 Tax=Sphingobacterium TaxID=28453 RepID=UPI002579F9DE|nr:MULTISPECIES: FecR family protein [Sphingobacterium]
MSKIEAYKRLIRQYYDDNLQGESLTQFIKYMDDEDFLDAWEQIKLEEETVNRLGSEIDNQNMFEKVTADERIKHQLLELDPLRKTVMFPWRSIVAAALLLVVGVGSLIYFIGRLNGALVKEKQLTTNRIETVLPGKDRAEIILENGRRIDLEKIKGDTIIDHGDFEIIKTAAGSISYHIKDGVDPHKPVYNSIVTPRGGEYNLTLPDGTQVWLNASTSLKYPVVFDKSKREVELYGEAYFDVAKRTELGKRTPFIIHAGAQSIEVLGTSFNVQNYGKKIITTLVEGKVKLNFKDTTIPDQFLQPNDQAIYEHESNQFSIDPIDPFYSIAWKDGNFAFYKTPLVEVMAIIGRWYDVQVEFKSKFEDFQFSGTISKYSDIKKLLKTIELVGGVHFELTGRKIYVKN